MEKVTETLGEVAVSQKKTQQALEDHVEGSNKRMTNLEIICADTEQTLNLFMNSTNEFSEATKVRFQALETKQDNADRKIDSLEANERNIRMRATHTNEDLIYLRADFLVSQGPVELKDKILSHIVDSVTFGPTPTDSRLFDFYNFGPTLTRFGEGHLDRNTERDGLT